MASTSEPFSWRLFCKTVTADGLTYGAAMEGPHCTNVRRCLAAEGCAWRKFHGLPPHIMAGKRDVVLD